MGKPTQRAAPANTETILLDPRNAQLRRVDDVWFLEANEQRIALSDDEASYFIGHQSGRSLAYAASMQGIFIKDDRDEILERRLDEFHSLNGQLSRELLNIMLDTSTMRNALDCIDGRANPVGLLDLSTLCYAVVFFDRVVLEARWSYWDKIDFDRGEISCRGRIPDDFADMLVRPDNFPRGTLWTMAAESTQALTGLEDQFREGWSRLFQVESKQIKMDLRRWSHYQDSPAHWSGLFADGADIGFSESQFRLALGRIDDGARDSLEARGAKEAQDYLSLLTMRTVYYDVLAGFLGLPYLPSSLRGHVYGPMVEAKVHYRNIVAEILGATGGGLLADSVPNSTPVSLPFLLGIVVGRTRKREEFWSELLKLRDEAASFRAAIRDSREDWLRHPSRCSSAFAERASGVLPTSGNQAAKALQTVIGAGVSAGITVATSTPVDRSAFGLAIKLAKLLNPADRLRQYYLRRFRPEVYFITNLVDEAARLDALESEIHRIWGSQFSEVRRAFFRRLMQADLGPHNQPIVP